MFQNLKKYIFPSIITLSALSISVSAAYYSVFGLSKLFSGAAFAIIVMATALEASKLIVASSLHRYWKTMNALLKWYLVIALISLMAITSAGIYGFLTSAYQETSNKSQVVEKEIALIENKKEQYYRGISRDSLNITQKNNRITQLADLRKQQENRLDSLYQKGWYNSARETEGIIKEANEDIKILEAEVDTLNQNITSSNDSLTILDKQIFEAQLNNDAAAELGPLKYVAELTGQPMDRVINWFMLLIIFVFDPLAIALVINANFAFSIIKPKEKTPLPPTPTPTSVNIPSPPTPPEEKPTTPPPPPRIRVEQTPPPQDNTKQIEELKNKIRIISQSGLSERKRNATIKKLNQQLNKLLNNSENTKTY